MVKFSEEGQRGSSYLLATANHTGSSQHTEERGRSEEVNSSKQNVVSTFTFIFNPFFPFFTNGNENEKHSLLAFWEH